MKHRRTIKRTWRAENSSRVQRFINVMMPMKNDPYLKNWVDHFHIFRALFGISSSGINKNGIPGSLQKIPSNFKTLKSDGAYSKIQPPA
jgi:hypothetical protein